MQVLDRLVCSGRLTQLVEYLPDTQEVIGSSPIATTIEQNPFVSREMPINEFFFCTMCLLYCYEPFSARPFLI